MQDDVLLSTFTPFGSFIVVNCLESFMFTSKLRLTKLTDEERLIKVQSLITELGLDSCKNYKIGNEYIKGISGGQRKRTSIGVELLTNPSLIFLDEPTTGLDSSTALSVIEILKQLSKNNVNIVCTIHQPSTEIFNTFQKLILLCEGSVIY